MSETNDTSYSIKISLDNETLTTLKTGGYTLYAFRAVKAPGGSLPVIWQSIPKYFNDIEIDWTVSYGAYISSTTIKPGVVIKTSSKAKMELGSKYVIDNKGIPSIKTGGPDRSITITNHETIALTCGICEVVDEDFRPLCASPVLSGFSDVIEPIQKIALIFATPVKVTSTVIQYSLGPGVLLDVTKFHNRKVDFTMGDSNEAKWIPDPNEGNYILFDSDSDISPLLINPDSAPQAF